MDSMFLIAEMNTMELLIGFSVLTIVGLIACGIFAYYFGQLNSRLQSLENAINKLEQRDEKVSDSLDCVATLKGEMNVYKRLIDEGRELTGKQRQYIAKLLQRSDTQGKMIGQIVAALKQQGINININGGTNTNQFGDNNEG